MYLKFCKDEDVTLKNQVFLIFKAAFLAKIKSNYANGLSQVTQGRIQGWIDDNIDDLYDELL